MRPGQGCQGDLKIRVSSRKNVRLYVDLVHSKISMVSLFVRRAELPAVHFCCVIDFNFIANDENQNNAQITDFSKRKLQLRRYEPYLLIFASFNQTKL